MMTTGRWAEPLTDTDDEQQAVILKVWRILSDADIDALLGCDVADFEDDDEPAIEDDIRYAEHCIEDDYDWIRTGC